LKRRSQPETEQEKRSGEFSEARQDYVVLPWPPLRGGEGGGDDAGRELPVEQRGNFASSYADDAVGEEHSRFEVKGVRH